MLKRMMAMILSIATLAAAMAVPVSADAGYDYDEHIQAIIDAVDLDDFYEAGEEDGETVLLPKEAAIELNPKARSGGPSSGGGGRSCEDKGEGHLYVLERITHDSKGVYTYHFKCSKCKAIMSSKG